MSLVDEEITIPKVTGRHHNSALAAERRRRAVGMVLSGSTYQHVADTLGYANRGTVHRIVKNALSAHEAEDLAHARALECDRLDALQAGVWDAALAGDITAVNTVLRIIERRCQILGLDQRSSSQRLAGPTPTLVSPASLGDATWV